MDQPIKPPAARRQRCWDDVRVGEELPGYSLTLNATRIVTAVSGTQDFFPVHHDKDYAASCGLPDVFVNTHFLEACFGRLLCDWIGDEGFIRKFSMEMRRMNRPGDILSVKGKVIGKNQAEDRCYADVEAWIENSREGISTTANATIRLPGSR